MSNYLFNYGAQYAMMQMGDDRAIAERFRYASRAVPIKSLRLVSSWMIRSRMIAHDITGAGSIVGDDEPLLGNWRAPFYSGMRNLKRIHGYTKTATGAIAPNCPVKAFLTSSNLLVTSTTSDANGYFELFTPYTTSNHFLVGYLSGSPDIFGASLNTVTGA